MTPQQAAALMQAGQMTPAQYQLVTGGDWQPPSDVGDAGSSQATAATQGPAAPAAAPPPPPAFDPAAVNALFQAGKITAAQYTAMGGTAPLNAVMPTASPLAAQAAAATSAVPQPSAAPAKKPNLVVAGQPAAGQSASPVVAAPQGQPPTSGQSALGDVLAMPSGGGAHAVGFSPADKNMLGSLNEQGELAQTDAERTANGVQQIAATFAGQNDALAAESKQGLLDYTHHLQDNADRRNQLLTQTQDAQSRIQSQLSDLQANGVDANRYFSNQSTGQKILGAMAIGLGAFGAHALGPNGHDSTNTALEIMNGAIARDVEEQKTNLQKSLGLLSSRMNLNSQGFDQQKALLESERESIQTGYAVANNEIAKRAAMFKDNADLQTNALKMQAGLKASADEKIGAINGQIYGLQKGAERVVGGIDVVKQRLDRAVALKADLDKLDPNSPDAQKAAAEVEKLKAEATKSTAEASKVALPNGGKPPSPRLARRMAELDAQDANAQELDSILDKGTSASPSDRARAAALGETLRNAGHKSIPENPLEFFSSTTARRAGLGEVRKDIEREKNSLLKYGTGGSEGDSEDEGNPAGLEKEVTE